MRLDISPKKILVLKPSALGDIIHSMPALAAVRRRFPDAEIHWVVAKGLEPLVEDHPMIDEVVIFDRRAWKRRGRLARNLLDTGAFLKKLSRNGYDLALDMQGLLRTGLMAKMSKAPMVLGFRGAREGASLFYHHRIAVDWKTTHAVDRYLKLVEPLGCDISKVEFPLFPFERDIPLTRGLPDRYAVMAPSAGKPANRWPAERFGAVAAGLDIPTVVVGTDVDEEIAEQLVANSAGKAVSITGRTDIKGLAAVLAKAEFVLANDTGPAHLAAAIGTPVAALFGPANPVRTRPYGAKNIVIQTKDRPPCNPCNRKGPCPSWRCFDSLTPEMALEFLREKKFGPAE